MTSATPPNRFCQAEHRQYLAAVAVHILRGREAQYPARVSEGRMTPAEAAQGLELARVLARQWQWIVDPARPPLPDFDLATASYFGAMEIDLERETATIAANARQRAQHRPDDADVQTMADLCEALAWLQARPRRVSSRIVLDVDVSRQMAAREDASAPPSHGSRLAA